MTSETETQVTLRDGHVEVCFTGEFNRTAGKRVVDTMVEACRAAGFSRILLDCSRMHGRLSIVDRFVLAEYGARTIDRHISVAVVGRDGDILPDRFFENAAVSRGVRVRAFADADEALAWLRQRP